MNTCSTCGTQAKSFDLSIPQTNLSPSRRPGEKLEFVEHVLGVLIESRFGPGNPYSRLGDQPVTTGHSQMFANVGLLSAAESEAHLNSVNRHFQTSLLCGFLCGLCELCVRIRTFHAKLAKDAKGTQNDGYPPRGSPTSSGTYKLAYRTFVD